MCRNGVALLGLLVIAGGCQPSSTSQPAGTSGGAVAPAEAATTAVSTMPPKERALAARDALTGALSTRLTEAITRDGPGGAIDVCSQEAPQIAVRIGKTHGVKIGRTSFQLRNPKNAPPEWAQALIPGRPKDPLFVDLPEGGTGAFLPILLQGRCVTCHGPKDKIPDSVLAKLAEHYPDDQATGFHEGDLRGWFWVEVPASPGGEQTATSSAAAPAASDDPAAKSSDATPAADAHAKHGDAAVVPGDDHPPHGPGFGRGMGRGPGRGGPGMMGGNRADMTTIHAMFESRDKIKRTVTKTPTGAVAVTESDDPQLVELIQEHVPAMETRVLKNEPLPPMTFHPIFVELIQHAEDYTLAYEETEKGVRVTYTAEDPFVIMLVQEHSQLVSRFLQNGMEEIHKEYELPQLEAEAKP